ncbi:hypothetical protein [Paenibacillus harenae]|uniref:hypothetical protein n=1 Tax=Paenibacillus harenae TaxID=306543 RepID=UPI000492776D|nr:hypothetical protein [Paenibacillus harenae]
MQFELRPGRHGRELRLQRLSEAFQKPKVLEDVVKKINLDRIKSVAPLQKELTAIDKELATIESQRKRFFKLFETSGVDDDLFIERLSELKVQHEQLTRRKAEAELQLADNTSDPVPLQHVRQALAQFHKLLEDVPPETQKTLLQTVVKQIHLKDRRKVAGIELEFDPTVQKHFFELALSAKTAEGAFAFRKQKSPSRYRIVLCPQKARRSLFALSYSPRVDHPKPMPSNAPFHACCGIFRKNLPLLMIRFTVSL